MSITFDLDLITYFIPLFVIFLKSTLMRGVKKYKNNMSGTIQKTLLWGGGSVLPVKSPLWGLAEYGDPPSQPNDL